MIHRFYIFLLLIVSSFLTKAQYTNLVLEGGGMKGIAYAGAFEVLDSLGISDSIQNVAGTSSGAMNGLMYAIGYSGKEISHLNLTTNFGKYNQVGVPLIGGVIRLRKKYGYYKTDRFMEDLGKILKAKGFSEDLTFKELYQLKKEGRPVKLLYITGTNLTDQKLEVFSHETYPNMRLLDAVKISISIPLYFEAVFMNPDGSLVEQKAADSSTMVMSDGGVLDNYPFFVFDTLVTTREGNTYYKCNPHTLGLKLETDTSQDSIAPRDIKNTSSFVEAYTALSSEYLNRRLLGPQQLSQTIFINVKDFNPKIKRQRKSVKEEIISFGKHSAQQFFNNE